MRPITPGLARLVAAVSVVACVLWQSPAAAEDAPEALFSQGVALFEGEQYREAAEVFRRVFEIDPNPFVLFNIGRCYHELGELETATKYYDRSLALDGLPREAKIEAIKRLDDIQQALEARRAKDAAAERIGRALADARQALGDRAAELAPAAGAPGEPLGTVPPDDPQPAPGGRGALTWVGAGIGVVGLAAVGGGTWFALGVGDDLDRHSGLVDEYRTLQSQALESGDSELAGRALTMADEANTLATSIEQDQRFSVALFAAGGAMIIGGVVMILADSPDDTDVTVVASPTGFAVVGLW